MARATGATHSEIKHRWREGKKESFSLRVSPALHPPERPSPRRADMAGHGHGSGNAGTEETMPIIGELFQMP